MPESSTRSEGLRTELDALAQRGSVYLRRYAWKDAVEKGLQRILTISMVVPFVLLAVVLMSALTGASLWPLGIVPTLLTAVLVPVIVVLVYSTVAWFRHNVDRRLSLALFDRELGLHDRLQTADEFLNKAEMSAYEAAAIDDASKYSLDASRRDLGRVQVAAPTLKTSRWLHGVTALFVLAAGLLINGSLPFHQATAAQSSGVAAAAHTELDSPSESAQQESPETPDIASMLPAGTRKLSLGASDEAPRTESQRTERPESSGLSSFGDQVGVGGGESRQSQSGGSDSSAAGKRDVNQGDPKKRKAQRQESQNRSMPQSDESDQSPSKLAGGSGSGSGHTSSSLDLNEMPSKTSQDELDDDLDDEVEEEEDEQQEAGAGSKPMLSQRKAPADRQLTPSGDGEQQENPDANGRSGPGGLKKTRGVAAMLLGVPLPDQLTGQVSPGRIKVQREQSIPTERSSASVAAQARSEIDESIGEMESYAPELWMRETIKAYFLDKHAESISSE